MTLSILCAQFVPVVHSPLHVFLECDGYTALRQELFTNLTNTVPEKWAHLNTLPSDERAFRMLSHPVPDPESAERRVVDGSNAMA